MFTFSVINTLLSGAGVNVSAHSLLTYRTFAMFDSLMFQSVNIVVTLLHLLNVILFLWMWVWSINNVLPWRNASDSENWGCLL
jgi:hypothetical protein